MSIIIKATIFIILSCIIVVYLSNKIIKKEEDTFITLINNLILEETKKLLEDDYNTNSKNIINLNTNITNKLKDNKLIDNIGSFCLYTLDGIIYVKYSILSKYEQINISFNIKNT